MSLLSKEAYCNVLNKILKSGVGLQFRCVISISLILALCLLCYFADATDYILYQKLLGILLPHNTGDDND